MSGLRCKPGDLAVMVGAPIDAQDRLGNIVTVLRSAPMEDFALPDGVIHAGASAPDRWVVEFPRPVSVPMIVGRRDSLYGVVPDWALRPIRPDADEPAIETEREKEAA